MSAYVTQDGKKHIQAMRYTGNKTETDHFLRSCGRDPLHKYLVSEGDWLVYDKLDDRLLVKHHHIFIRDYPEYHTHSGNNDVLQTLLRRIEELEDRIKSLENKND